MRLRPMLLVACTAAGLALAGTAHAAGTVKVEFKPQDQMSDVGHGFDGERVMRTLAAYFESLAARLPDGQTLSVQVTDVNLAGETRPTRFGGDVRVLRGRADWPTMDLRWTLSAEGRTLSQGEEHLADLNYLANERGLQRERELPYETRLIDRWFSQRVVPGR